ncbi:MAG: hypothetical protein ACXVIC_00035 [Halobacteriota archaeon]
METTDTNKKLFISFPKNCRRGKPTIPKAPLPGTGGNSLEVKQKVLALIIGVALIVLSIQVTTASTDCPTCKVVYNDATGPASAQQVTSTGREPLSFLDPSSGSFMSGSQMNVLNVVLGLL